jgi:DNA-directed RNA polymerase subunit alpha
MDGNTSIIDKLLAGQVHGISDLEKLRLEHIKSGITTSAFIKNVEKISQSNLSNELKNENKAFAYWICGQYKLIIESTKLENGSALAKFVLGHSHLCRSEYTEAAKLFSTCFNASEPFHVAAYVDTLLGLDKVEEAQKIYEKGKASNSSDKFIQYALARIKEFCHEMDEAMAIYKSIYDENKEFHLVAFRLANLYDLYNENERAISTYLRCIPYGYTPVNSLINLGLLYEDDDHYAKAISCFKKALEIDETNLTARLHLSNSMGSQNMIFDEKKDQEKKATEKILNVPVSDFELSVRSRNCLSKMNILTLGDLVNRTEEDLLSYKNFGETSLKEIKEMLNQRVLSLKSSKEENKDLGRTPMSDMTSIGVKPGTPIDSLQISLRSRKCLERLNITTLEELTRYSKDDLMAIRNFGQTSFDEIIILLNQHNLNFKP